MRKLEESLKTAKISALPSGKVSKNELFLTAEHVLPKKDWLERAVALKRLEDSLLGKELKKQTKVAVKRSKIRI